MFGLVDVLPLSHCRQRLTCILIVIEHALHLAQVALHGVQSGLGIWWSTFCSLVAPIGSTKKVHRTMTLAPTRTRLRTGIRHLNAILARFVIR